MRHDMQRNAQHTAAHLRRRATDVRSCRSCRHRRKRHPAPRPSGTVALWPPSACRAAASPSHRAAAAATRAYTFSALLLPSRSGRARQVYYFAPAVSFWLACGNWLSGNCLSGNGPSGNDLRCTTSRRRLTSGWHATGPSGTGGRSHVCTGTARTPATSAPGRDRCCRAAAAAWRASHSVRSWPRRAGKQSRCRCGRGKPQSRCRCGRGEPQSRCRCGSGELQSRCRCGSSERSPGAYLGG
jgi:hypothetical protein